jgi:uncharacterized protein YegJ (DUF2314 family)
MPEPTPFWVHTHGLASLGGFDLDILDPSRDIAGCCSEVMRALAFGIIEGEFVEGELAETMNRELLHLVPVKQFHDKASAKDSQLRELDENHDTRRVVLCDPPPQGALAFLKSKAVRPSTFLRKYKGDAGMITYSLAASELVSKRVRNTASVFASLDAEFAKLPFPRVIKAAYQTDSDPKSHEHMWFEVEKIGPNSIRAKLAVHPFDIKSMSEGATYDLPFERLSDWMIHTPMGAISPRSMRPARYLRETPELIQEMLELFNALSKAERNAQGKP